MKLKDKNVVVYGLGRSGDSVVDFLCIKGANVFVFDDNKNKLQEYITDSRKITILKNLCELNIKIMDIMIISPGVSVYNEGVKLAQLLGVKVYGELEFASLFIKKPIIAITGTNGKTTTVNLLKKMFDNSTKKAILAGNVGEPAIEFVNKKTDKYILEVSSFMLESATTFHPKVSAILNITKDHLDRHFTMNNYIKTKCKIAQNMTSKDHLVLNYDDENLQKIFSSKTKPKIIWFSAKNEVDGAYLKDDILLYKKGKKIIPICDRSDIALLGDFNISNVLCAICIAMINKLKVKQIQKAIREFMPLEHRLEIVKKIDGITYINDSKSTTVQSTIEATNALQGNTLLLVGGADKNDDYFSLAKKINNRVIKTIIFGSTKYKIREGFDKQKKPYILCDNLREALEQTKTLTNGVDNVLLSPACSSKDEFDNYLKRGEYFKNFVNSLYEK